MFFITSPLMVVLFILLCMSISSYDVGVDAQTPPNILHSSSLPSAIDDNDRRYIVKFKQPKATMSSFSLRSSIPPGPPPSYTRVSEDDPRVIKILSPDSGTLVMMLDTEEEVKFWESREDVEYVEPDSRVYLQTYQFDEGEYIPWGIKKVEALSVSDDQISFSSNQKVCVIDTGYEIDHPDLPPLPPKKNEGQITGLSQIMGEKWYEDGHGHGTHVAGTIAAVGNNNRGVVGVNRNGELKLHIVKVFNNKGEWTRRSNLISAVESCVYAEATIINMSLGGGNYSASMEDLYDRVYNESGILIVAAAGNSGKNEYSYPASYPAVMSVGAVDFNDVISSFSQFNDGVSIVAPGVGILSTHIDGKYAIVSGTSMSTPHVAGVAALIWSHFPEKSAQDIRKALEESAKDLGSNGWDEFYGHGLLHAESAYNYLLGGDGSNNGDDDGEGGENQDCNDDPIGWHDSDGDSYDCEWYGSKNNCKTYGESFRNMGKTANTACCICGGGKSTSPSPSSSQSSLPTQASVSCGCPNTCTSNVLAKQVGGEGLTVLDQILWFQDNFGVSEINACIFACGDWHNDLCGECDPSSCGG